MALIAGIEEERKYFHALEIPVAQLCALTANMNRDPKKQKKPFSVDDFTFFAAAEESLPESRAAIAYMTLVERNELPAWALFCLNDFKSGKGKTYPTDPAVKGDGLLLLAPVEYDNKIKGLLIAEQKVSGKQVAVEWEGHRMLVSVPKFDGFVSAKADTDLIILRQLADGLRP